MQTFTAAGFQGQVNKAFAESIGSMVSCIDAYVFAQGHLVEIRRRWPGFCLSILADKFIAVYNVRISTLMRILKTFCVTKDLKAYVFSAITQRTGATPWATAVETLPKDTIGAFLRSLPPLDKITAEDVRRANRLLVPNPEPIPEAAGSVASAASVLRDENRRLRSENKELRKKVRELENQVRTYEARGSSPKRDSLVKFHGVMEAAGL